MTEMRVGSPESADSESPTTTVKKPGFGAIASVVLAIVAGAFAIARAQTRAPDSDFQNANMLSFFVGIFVVLFVTIQLHRICRARGHRLIVPVIVITLIALFLGRFQWVGFSGEMVPQFRSRFSADRIVQQAPTDIAAASYDGPTALASADSAGFLGPNRTGVIDERMFGIPDDGKSPEVLWSIGVGEGWSSFAVSGDRAVTMEQRESEECLTCYRLADGKLLWCNRHQGRHENTLGGVGPRSTPSIVGDRVYAQSATGFVWCVDLATGQEHWTVDLLEIAGWTQLDSEVVAPWGRAASPLVVDGLCIIPLGAPESHSEASNRSLIAFDADDGNEKWRAGTGQISYASPMLMTLAETRQVVSVNEKTVTGHHVGTGSQLWSFRWPGQTNGGATCAAAIQVDANKFLIGKGYGGGSALARVESAGSNFVAKEVWASTRVFKTKFTHACVDGNVAYAISNGILQAVSIEDEQVIWSQPRSDRAGSGQILLVDDVIVVQNEHGDVSFVRAGTSDYALLCNFNALDSKTWNIPTIAGRHLLVRNDREAVCFLLPPRQ